MCDTWWATPTPMRARTIIGFTSVADWYSIISSGNKRSPNAERHIAGRWIVIRRRLYKVGRKALLAVEKCGMMPIHAFLMYAGGPRSFADAGRDFVDSALRHHIYEYGANGFLIKRWKHSYWLRRHHGCYKKYSAIIIALYFDNTGRAPSLAGFLWAARHDFIIPYAFQRFRRTCTHLRCHISIITWMADFGNIYIDRPTFGALLYTHGNAFSRMRLFHSFL